MKVTSNKDLKIEEIKFLTEEELRELYFQRIIEWVITPMEILSKDSHTGWAILQLFLSIYDLLGGAMKLPDGLHQGCSVLREDQIILAGDLDRAFEVVTMGEEDEDGCGGETFIMVNPSLLIELAHTAVSAIKSLGDLCPIDMEEFRDSLIRKAEASEN